MTIGAADDIRAARLDDVRAFFQTYYRPRNASLALAGDIDTDKALALATDYFGALDSGDEPPPVVVRVRRPRSRPRSACRSRIESSCRGCISRGIRRRSSPPTTPSSISSAKCSRAARRRVSIGRWCTSSGWPPRSPRRRTRARSAATSRSSRRRRPGRTLAELERAISQVARRRSIDEGPTALEMERCQAQAEANFIYRLQTVGGFGGKGDQLNAYNVFVGDPGFFDDGPGAISARSRRKRCSVRRARGCGPRRASCSASFPTGRAALALDGSQPVSVA